MGGLIKLSGTFVITENLQENLNANIRNLKGKAVSTVIFFFLKSFLFAEKKHLWGIFSFYSPYTESALLKNFLKAHHWGS